ncbi:MAG: sugar phosphate nucleotidyltransferase [Promethearchaeota archaeon]|jgi:NDP-sugar pyrophosphorylase family protein
MEIKLSQLKNNSTIKLKSIILCAGEGSRISNFISNKPKPLIEINHKPLLSHLISHLVKSHITSIIIVTGHLKDQIENYIKESIQKKNSLRNKILIINSGNEYKKGPLYSLLSITKEKRILKKDLIYLVFPGDTYFEFNLIRELITSININSGFNQNNSMIFYQELQGNKLKKSGDMNKTISIIKTEEVELKEVIKSIEQLNLNSISESGFYKKIIPVFIFDFKFLQYIIDEEKKVSVKTIREIVNKLIKGNNVVYAYRLNSKYKYFDIDTKLALLNLRKTKEDNRRSDYSD